MARVEGFTYNGYVVGGAAPTDTTQIVGERFGWVFYGQDNDEASEFQAEFIITGTSRADLETKCTAMLGTLRTKYQKLSIDWGSTNVATYDPAVAQATGWDAIPIVTKSKRRTRSVGFQRGFEFRARVSLPSNYTDPNLSGNPAANGRRTSNVQLHWDADNKRKATVIGVFHQTANTLPRAKTTTAQINNPTGAVDTYCVKRLGKIDNAAQWTLITRDETDNNQQTVMTFRREYVETIGGRWMNTPEIGYLASTARIITFRGVFYRTYSAAYDGSATKASSVNYADVTNGGKPSATTALAALTAAQGGALTVGTDCELIYQKATPNDQDDRTDFVLIYREEIFKQSNAASGLDDPDVVMDSVGYFLDYTPLDDSLVATGGGGGSDPNPFKPTPGSAAGAGGGKPGSTSGGRTLDASVTQPSDPSNPNGTAQGTVSGTQPVKPITLVIKYSATIKKTVTGLKTKWLNDIRPWLLGQWSAQLGFSPTYLQQDHFEEDVTASTIASTVSAIVLPGDLIGYVLEEAVEDDLGVAPDKVATGTPHEYLLQQAFPGRKKYRRHTAIFKQGGSFDPSVLLSTSPIPGYYVLRRSAPKIATKMVGISGQGVSTATLTAISFVEELLYVAKNVGQLGNVPSGAPAGADNRTATAGGRDLPVQPANPGGQ